MGRLVSIDGTIVRPEDAKVSVYDRGFLYGDSIFETLRTYGGKPLALAEHMARLASSAERVAITLPIAVDVIAAQVVEALAAAQNPESTVRVMVTRGTGPLGLDPNLAEKPLIVTMVEPLSALSTALYRDGVSVITFRTERASDHAPGAKVGNYLAGVLAIKAAKAVGAHEAILLDASGHVVEGTTSNVFALRNGVLHTPSEEAGILVGITHAEVLEAARLLALAVDTSPMFPADLHGADEVFISSTIREILPAVRVDDRPVGDGLPGPVTRALHRAFRERVGLGDRPMPWEG